MLLCQKEPQQRQYTASKNNGEDAMRQIFAEQWWPGGNADDWAVMIEAVKVGDDGDDERICALAQIGTQIDQ